LGILPGHRPLLTTLTIGEVAYRQGRRWTHLVVEWGFAEVLPDRVIVLAETAASVADIDPEAILKAKQRAEERLRSKNPDVDVESEMEQLRRALARLAVWEKETQKQHE
jgi:F-type H+-transporting ATPase subunit epsilon